MKSPPDRPRCRDPAPALMVSDVLQVDSFRAHDAGPLYRLARLAAAADVLPEGADPPADISPKADGCRYESPISRTPSVAHRAGVQHRDLIDVDQGIFGQAGQCRQVWR